MKFKSRTTKANTRCGYCLERIDSTVTCYNKFCVFQMFAFFEHIGGSFYLPTLVRDYYFKPDVSLNTLKKLYIYDRYSSRLTQNLLILYHHKDTHIKR